MRRCVHHFGTRASTSTYSADTDGLEPMGTGLVSAWRHCSGTFLCVTRLDLTLHFGLLTHIGVANALSGFCKDTRTRTHMHSDGSRIEAKLGRHKSALRALKAGHLFTCACTQPRKRILCSA